VNFAASNPKTERTRQGLLNYYAIYFLLPNTAQETTGTTGYAVQYSAGQ
jgi:hypothetical protein